MSEADQPFLSCLKVLVTWLPFFLLAPSQNTESLEKNFCSYNPKALKIQKESKSNHPISFFCVLYKILEKLIHARVKSIIYPPSSAGSIGSGRFTLGVGDQPWIKQFCYFGANSKASFLFVDLPAAYDTVSHRCLTCKLLRLLSDKHTIRIIMELVQNRSFPHTTGGGKQDRLQRLKTGVPQGSVFAPLL